MIGIVLTVLRDETGAAAIEYGLLAALVSAAVIVVLTALGVNLAALFTTVSSNLQGAASGA